MKKITISVLFFAVVTVAFAELCCLPNSLSANEKTKTKKTNVVAAVDPKMQVLTLRPLAGKNPRLIEEWRNQNKSKLDWKFVCLGGPAAQEVYVHQSVVLKYSPLIFEESKTLAFNGIPKSKHDLYFTKEIVECLMTLLYEHTVTIKKSDYSQIISAARTLGFNKLIQRVP